MKPWVQREEDKIRTASLGIYFLDALINNKNYDNLINELKTININTFRIGRQNKWKALYNWLFQSNWDEQVLKQYNPNADYNYIVMTLKNICKKVVKTHSLTISEFDYKLVK